MSKAQDIKDLSVAEGTDISVMTGQEIIAWGNGDSAEFHSRFVTEIDIVYRTGTYDAGEAILAALEGVANNHLRKRFIDRFLSWLSVPANNEADAGVDISHPKTRKMIADFRDDGILTPLQANKLFGLSAPKTIFEAAGIYRVALAHATEAGNL